MTPAPFPQRMVTLGRQIRHDPLLGHAFMADIHRRVPHECGAYFVRTNAQGFRDDHNLALQPDGYHVMCYGDSFTAGDGVSNGQRFSSLLAAQFGITVSNVAVPGHGPDQNVLQLENVALPRPDLILWCIAVHTIERIQSQKRITIDREGRLWQVDRPHFVLADDDSLELRGVPVTEQGDELVEEPFPQVRSPFEATRRGLAAKLRARMVSIFGSYLKSAPDAEYTDPTGPAWRLLAALVRRFHTAARAVPVVVVPLPTARYLAEDHEAHFQRRFAELEQPVSGLHVVDVLAGMRETPRRERIGFCYRSDGHYTAAGHAAVAAALAEQLRHRGLVPSSTVGQHAITPTKTPPEGVSLHVRWQANDAAAQVCSSDGTILAERREVALLANAYRAGALPLSAIHACLDDAHIAGPELRAIILRSPCTIFDLLHLDREDPQWLIHVAGWIRWHGAAASDLRNFLAYQGPIEHTAAHFEGHPTHLEPPTDGEASWLRQRTERLRHITNSAVLQRRLLRLARSWELATRAAREVALPTAAPLRRGRMALRLRKAADNQPA